MKYRLKSANRRLKSTITLESSKSESNRALIINALANGESSNVENLSNARDTQTMLRLLTEKPATYDVKDAGTTMRFLTAFLAIHGEGELITGTERMKQRPIGPLVDALRQIGARIEYQEQEGYPPMKIWKVGNQQANLISIPGNISSQYISALLMIAPCLKDGLTIQLTTEIFSRPYIEMTLAIMQNFGVQASWEGQDIDIQPQTYQPRTYTIEGDWSGASYWYSFVSLSEEGSKIELLPLRESSTQGDQEIATIMDAIGVQSEFENNQVTITSKGESQREISIDFRNCPDLAQTVLVSAAVKGVSLKMTGLESLKIKETDRITAMQNELAKIGAKLEEHGNTWSLTPTTDLPKEVEIETYEDHRMAMAFAPLSQVMEVIIQDPMVVEKSYPKFWKDVELVGIQVEQIS